MFESITAFFALGAVGFYIFLLFMSIVFIRAVENDKYGAVCLMVPVAIGLYWQPIIALASHWQLIILGLFVYGFIGGCWSVFRWFKYCKKIINENAYSKRYSHEEHVTPEQYYGKMLSPQNHKSTIIGWIIFWPWSAIWNITGDFFTSIYDSLDTVYLRVSKYAIKKALKLH